MSVQRVDSAPRLRAGDGDHLGNPHELDPGATRGSAESPLVLVDRLPAVPGDQGGHAGLQPGLDRVAARLPWLVEPTTCVVLEHPRDRVGGALLVRADDARRAALDPAD